MYIKGGSGTFESCSFDGNTAVSITDILMVHELEMSFFVFCFRLHLCVFLTNGSFVLFSQL